MDNEQFDYFMKFIIAIYTGIWVLAGLLIVILLTIVCIGVM